jgi:hypothetical protein
VDLTPLQRKALMRYQALRTRPESLAANLKRSLPRLLLGIVLVVLGIYTLPTTAAALYGGMLLGAAIRHLSLAVQARKVLPVFLDVIDWDKVDERLGNAGGRAANR